MAADSRFNINNIVDFRNIILDWYQINGREFLWRNKSASNYQLIISEIFLQRTRAETVSKFLPFFFNKYPSWQSLSSATVDELQEIIKPLGLYKQRGSRLYKLAQELKRKNGRMPQNRNELMEMPGIGQYIANAFELYALKKRSPLLDVNMARLLERYFGERTKADIRYDPYLQGLAVKVTDIPEAKDLNWAILDFAALVCKKNNPKCQLCQLRTNCKKGSEWLKGNIPL